MAEEGNPSSPGPEGGTQPAGDPPARPEHIPEKYWDAEKGVARVDDLAKGYNELSVKLGQGREAVVAELEAERVKNRPASADHYKLEIPSEGPVAERVAKSNLVLLDKAPGEDFTPEEGKRYFVMDKDSPLLGYWRDLAYRQGFSNEQFMDGIVAFAEAEMAKHPTPEQLRAMNEAEWAKLGEHGKARADHAWQKLVATVGEDKAKALEGVMVEAGAIEAVEILLEKAGEPRFSPAASGEGAESRDALLAEAKKLQGESDYWQSKEKQAKVAEIFKKLYPGTRRTAARNPSFVGG